MIHARRAASRPSTSLHPPGLHSELAAQRRNLSARVTAADISPMESAFRVRRRVARAVSASTSRRVVIVDKSKKFQYELGQWDQPGEFYPRKRRKQKTKRREDARLRRCHESVIGYGNVRFGEHVPSRGSPRSPHPGDGHSQQRLSAPSSGCGPQSGIRLSFTWCMGGLTFFLFLVEIVTGVLLMFYYRPTVEYAYVDIQGLRAHVTLGLLREMHRWGARDGHHHLAAHAPRVSDQEATSRRGSSTGASVWILLVLTLLLSFTGYLLPGTSWPCGRSPWDRTWPGHRWRVTKVRPPRSCRSAAFPWYTGGRRSFRAVGRHVRRTQCASSVLCLALRVYSGGGDGPARGPFLADRQGRRSQRASVGGIGGFAEDGCG